MAQLDCMNTMTLYSDPSCPFCHRVRLAFAEKSVTVAIHDLSKTAWPEDIAMAIPYGKSPVLTDRDLVLFDSNIIVDYIDERFVQPPLVPYDPTLRAQLRLMRHRIDHDWYRLWPVLSGEKRGNVTTARQLIKEDLTVLSPVFETQTYFMSDQFSILDCTLAPLLWRLPMLNITLSRGSQALERYAERLFSRDSFQASLTEHERAMR